MGPSRNYVTAKRGGRGKRFALCEVREALKIIPKSRIWRCGTGGEGNKIAILALRNFWTTPPYRESFGVFFWYAAIRPFHFWSRKLALGFLNRRFFAFDLSLTRKYTTNAGFFCCFFLCARPFILHSNVTRTKKKLRSFLDSRTKYIYPV